MRIPVHPGGEIMRTILKMLAVAVVALILGASTTGCGNSPETLADAFACSKDVEVSDPADLDQIAATTFPKWYVSNSRQFTSGNDEFVTEWRRIILLRSGLSEPVRVGSTLKVPARCPKDTESKGTGDS